MKIRIIMDTHILTATIYNNPTARDFVSLLPLSIKLDDYANTEKIFYLPKKLSLQDAPAGMEPSKGDITYYAPWGNIAIFYRNFQYAKGLVILGKIDSDISILEKWNKSKEVKIEILKPE
ncbi:MAG: hypothetical protein H7A25_21035 [Leptospiraceae bacterium]|nr:hypothetical protein [Leptospiraceae bacterium]MCP5502395.1 hypothetical protein [Leptospiraceae bacterium]